MKIRIKHQILFKYNKPVFLEPMTIRIRPRCDCTQTLDLFSLSFSPQPAGRTECLEFEGNSVTRIWFQNLTQSLRISAESIVETLRDNPFDYIMDEPVLNVPQNEYKKPKVSLWPYLNPAESTRELMFFIREICPNGSVPPLEFLRLLTGKIEREFEHVTRPHGAPLPPIKCLRERQGACRDLAMLFIEICRGVGLPARFVSGYHLIDGNDQERELHAWAEVYLPGGGWRGYDPSVGLVVADSHVALASAVHPSDAAVVHGTFRGDEATSNMAYHIDIESVCGKQRMKRQSYNCD